MRLRTAIPMLVAAGMMLAAAESAQAEIRYAEPNGNGPSAAGECALADPCSLQAAVEGPVNDGDTVVLTPGATGGVYENQSTELFVDDAITLQGQAGQPRPVIPSSGAISGIWVVDHAVVQDLQLNYTQTGAALILAPGTGSATAERVTINSTSGGNACSPIDSLIRDSICRATTDGKHAVEFAISGVTNANVTLRNVTAIAPGASSTAIRVAAFNGADLTMNVRNTIAGGGLVADSGADVEVETNAAASTTASVNLDFSNYDTELESAGSPGTVSATDPGTLSNQTAPPLFADAPGADFHQAPGSPTIEAGTGAATLLGPLDLDGAPRSTDGNCDGAATPDIGADEYAANCPPPPGDGPGPDPAPKADGTLTIDANKGKVEKGRKVTLSGQLDVTSNEACEPNRPIQIQRRLKSEDDSKFQTFETVGTDAAGNYTLKAKVKKTYFYRAVVAETDACDDETSNSQKVRVQKRKAAQEA
jgi:hypothetical protein